MSKLSKEDREHLKWLERQKVKGVKIILRWFNPPESLAGEKCSHARMIFSLARVPVAGDVLAPYMNYRVKVLQVELFTQKHIRGTVARVYGETMAKGDSLAYG